MLSEILAGSLVTVKMAFAAWAVSLPLAVFVALRAARLPTLRRVVAVLSSGFVVIPFLAILFWVHYPLQNLLGVVWPPFYTCTVLLGVYISLSATEMLSSELIRLKGEYEDTAKVLGVRQQELLKKVVFPTSIYVSAPRLLTLAIVSIHITMFGSLIGVEELFRVILRLNARLLQPVELFSFMALAYTVLCLPLYLVAWWLQRFLARNL